MKKYFYFLIVLILFILAAFNFINYLFENTPVVRIENLYEEYDAKLNRLNHISKVLHYVDNQYGSSKIKTKDSLHYANLMARTLRMRFYHGLSNYTWKDNWLLYLISGIHPHSLSIVAPNDILKYPEALCSQQAIVGMEALKEKGFTYRKVGFFDSVKQNGHFTYEIFINGIWHFYDVNLEPNIDLMESLNRPEIDYISLNQELIDSLYSNQPEWIRKGLIHSYFRDIEVNEFPALKMLWFHRITLFFSLTLWFWLGLFCYFIYRKSKTQ